jgi:hypothetical protein
MSRNKFLRKTPSGSPRDKDGPTPKQNKWSDPLFARANMYRMFGKRSPTWSQYKQIMSMKRPVKIINGAIKAVKVR